VSNLVYHRDKNKGVRVFEKISLDKLTVPEKEEVSTDFDKLAS
jgi:hypothetical protein